MNPSSEREPECARWNFEASDAQLLVCRNLHDKGDDCDYQPLHPAEALQIINELRSRLLEHLARAALSTPHQAIQDLIKARDTFGWGPEVDEKINALRSLSTQPQQAGWMPISTAPKDGTCVLLFTADGVIEGYFWHNVWEQDVCGASYDMASAYIQCTPTHWMPLPLPPVPGQEGGGA